MNKTYIFLIFFGFFSQLQLLATESPAALLVKVEQEFVIKEDDVAEYKKTINSDESDIDVITTNLILKSFVIANSLEYLAKGVWFLLVPVDQLGKKMIAVFSVRWYIPSLFWAQWSDMYKKALPNVKSQEKIDFIHSQLQLCNKGFDRTSRNICTAYLDNNNGVWNNIHNPSLANEDLKLKYQETLKMLFKLDAANWVMESKFYLQELHTQMRHSFPQYCYPNVIIKYYSGENEKNHEVSVIDYAFLTAGLACKHVGIADACEKTFYALLEHHKNTALAFTKEGLFLDALGQYQFIINACKEAVELNVLNKNKYLAEILKDYQEFAIKLAKEKHFSLAVTQYDAIFDLWTQFGMQDQAKNCLSEMLQQHEKFIDQLIENRPFFEDKFKEATEEYQILTNLCKRHNFAQKTSVLEQKIIQTKRFTESEKTRILRRRSLVSAALLLPWITGLLKFRKEEISIIFLGTYVYAFFGFLGFMCNEFYADANRSKFNFINLPAREI